MRCNAMNAIAVVVNKLQPLLPLIAFPCCQASSTPGLSLNWKWDEAVHAFHWKAKFRGGDG